MMILNPYRYGGGGPAPTYATWNPADTSGDLALSGGDLVATRGAAANAFRATRATQSKSAGKWYFEIARTAGGDKTHLIPGLMVVSSSLNEYPGQSGTDTCGVQPLNTSDVNQYQNGFIGTAFGQSDVGIGGGLQFAVDLDNRRVWVKTFGAAGWMGGGDPAANTTPTFNLSGSAAVFPAAGLFSNGTEVTANFGASAFTGTVPSGFNAGWYK